MTTIHKKYIGITHPITDEGLNKKEFETLLQAWKISNCSQGIHLFDEVLSDDHYLFCDACEMEVHISKIKIPDGKDDVIT